MMAHTHTCTVTVTGGANVQSATASGAVTITVMGKNGLCTYFCSYTCKDTNRNEWGCRDEMHHAKNHGNKEIP